MSRAKHIPAKDAYQMFLDRGGEGLSPGSIFSAIRAAGFGKIQPAPQRDQMIVTPADVEAFVNWWKAEPPPTKPLSNKRAHHLWVSLGGKPYSKPSVLSRAIKNHGFGKFNRKGQWFMIPDDVRRFYLWDSKRENKHKSTTANKASKYFNAPISANSRNFYRPEAGELEKPLVKPELARLAGDVPEWSWLEQVKHGDRQSNEWGRMCEQ